MKLSDIHRVFTETDRDDWNMIGFWGAGSGPSFKYFLSSIENEDDTVSVGVESHHEAAIYKDDVNLSVAWGIDRDERWWEKNPRAISFDWQENFPDPSVSVIFADVFWCGNLVDRRHLIAVDGGRGYIPMPKVRSATGENVGFEEVFERESLDFARFIHDLQHSESFDHYISLSGLRVCGAND